MGNINQCFREVLHYDDVRTRYLLITDAPGIRRLSTAPFASQEEAKFLADSSVLKSSIAIVIGPTPPGTGVM